MHNQRIAELIFTEFILVFQHLKNQSFWNQSSLLIILQRNSAM